MKKFFNDNVEKKVIEMYLEGKSSKFIQIECCISHSHIYKVLKTNGIKVNRISNQSNDEHKYCRVCGRELINGINWRHSNIKGHSYICKKCNKEENEKYRFLHKNEIKSYNEKRKEKKKEYVKIYNLTPEGKTAIRKKNYKRRKLGFNPLNKYFNGCESHHVDHNNIIYIPKEWNRLINHNVHTGKNMDIINTYAYFFLLMQNIKDISKNFSFISN